MSCAHVAAFDRVKQLNIKCITVGDFIRVAPYTDRHQAVPIKKKKLVYNLARWPSS